MTVEAPPRDAAEQRTSPYRGLMPFTEADADIFFGREAEVRLIVDTARARRFGVLYGPSGVGKSSVLQAGVVRQIRDENVRRFERYGAAETVVAYLKEWRDDPYAALVAAVREAFAAMPGATTPLPERSPEDDVAEEILALRSQRGVDLLLILDQFEEFFLYHRNEAESFAELLDRLTERGTRINVLVSLREDALALLDEFEADIPAVFDNTLRLEHLDARAAEAAIRSPLDHHNAELPEAERVRIEDELVQALLTQLRTGKVQVDTSQGKVELGAEQADATRRIEAPYLQLVLTRLWDEEARRGSTVLRMSTLRDLGGAQDIVRQHLDRVMRGFSPPEMAVLADAFGHLVTPSGSKIAHRPSDLAEFSRNDPAQMAALMHRLAQGDQRILRDVPPPLDEPHAEARYEIFHDVLALAVLDWRRRFLAEAGARRQQAELLAEKEQADQAARDARHRLRRARLLVSVMAVLVLLCAGLAVWALKSQRDAEAAQRDAEEATTQQEQETRLSSVNRRLLTDPSSALVGAGGLRLDEDHDPDGRAQDAVRRSLDASDTDVILRLGVPLQLASFAGDDGIVAVTQEGHVLVWDVESQDPVRIDQDPRVDVTIEGRLLDSMTAASDSFLVLQTSQGVSAVDLASGETSELDLPDEFGDSYTVTTAAGGSRDEVLVYDYAGHRIVWRVAKNKVRTLARAGEFTGASAIDPSGRFVAAVVWDAPSRVVVTAVASDKEVASTPAVSYTDPDAELQDEGLAFTTTGSATDPALLLTPSTSRSEAALWQVLRDRDPTPLGDDTTWRVVYDTADLATGPTAVIGDGGEARVAIAGDKTVTVFDQDGTLQAQTAAGQDWKTGVVTNPSDASVFAVAANEGYVELYRTNLDPPQPMWTFRGHEGPVNDITFSGDGEHLVTGGADGTLRVWRLPPQMDFDWYIPDWILAARFNADGNYVFGFSPRFGYVTRLDREGRLKSLSPDPPLKGMAIDMDPAPDGSRAALVDYYCGPPVQIPMAGRGTAPFLDVPDTEFVCSTAVAWNPDPAAKQIVAGTSDGRLASWNPDTGEITGPVPLAEEAEDPGDVRGMAFAADASTLAVASGSGSNGRVYLVDPTTLTSTDDWAVSDVRTIDISRDGRFVAVAGSDRHLVRVWDTEHLDRKPLELDQARGSLGQVTLSPDDDVSRVAVTTSEGDVYVWDRASGRLLAVMNRHADAADEAAFDPQDIDHMYSAGDDGFLVSYSCDLCSMDVDDLEDAIEDRVAQVVRLDD